MIEKELKRIFLKYILPDLDLLIEKNKIKEKDGQYIHSLYSIYIGTYRNSFLPILSGLAKKEDRKINVYFTFLIRGATRDIKVGRVNMLYELEVDKDFIERLEDVCKKPNGKAKLEDEYVKLFS
jgi:hypothetical protein